MASHVTVIDASARRHVVKTTPGKYLTEILEEACTKFGVNASNYGLKSNNKALDLTRTFRLSGLTSGAKLELVLQSRSPTVISIALQLPEGEAQGVPQGRLTEKFPSTSTLWSILRAFESGTAGGLGVKKNFTQRGFPKTEDGANSGRLYYEMPVVNVVGRDQSTFTDLQKTLGQFGLKGGSALLRLSFQKPQKPLEDAMMEIEDYFKSAEAENPEPTQAKPATDGAPQREASETQAGSKLDSEAQAKPTETKPNIMDFSTEPLIPGLSTTNDSASPAQPFPTNSAQRTISVFAPPNSTTPKAALENHNPADYEHTLSHVKLHQARLKGAGYNKRLPNHSEVEAQAQEQAQKISEIRKVEIKIRFPDQTTVVSAFTNEDTAETLYGFVQNLMVNREIPFLLNYQSAKGTKTIPRDSKETLIAQLKLTGRLIVNFIWDTDATPQMRSAPLLRGEVTAQAKEIEVPEVKGVEVDEQDIIKGQGKPAGGEGKGKSGVPKWLKLPGKK